VSGSPSERINAAAARGFERGADDYERARPGYPDEAVAFVIEELGIGPGTTLLDLAAGTGKFTRQIAPFGARIVAVEPVEAMRAKLVELLPDVETVDGTAEALPQPDEWFDAVTCAQAFHWFDAPRALAEVSRVLRPHGGFAVVWNVRDEEVPWVARFTEIIIERTGGTPYRRDYTFEWWQQVFDATDRFTPLETQAFEHHQAVDRDTVIARAASTSFVSALADDRRAALLGELRDMLDADADLADQETFDFPHTTDVMWCHRC
jgi:ubiquinone/menaquinone biosynthesis C-methylase UbiE